MARNYNLELICYGKDLKKYFIRNKTVFSSTEMGKIEADKLSSAKNGDVVITAKENEVKIIEADFKDKYQSMKKGAQSIKLKDCGAILAETLVGKNSVCLDCGAGMGGLTNFLSRYVKKVYSCDYKQSHLETAKFNAELLDIKNVEFIECDIYEGIPVKAKLDLITLDIINPEKILPLAKKNLKDGGYLVAYCPQLTQLQEFVNTAREEGYEIIKVMEVNQREWKIEGRVTRPEHIGLQHTAFLSIVRKIW